MGNINILDPLTANQIAAGEVVERPVSVVKELIENSIDAGSTRIKITLVEGGIKRIQVLDNGAGMNPEDLVMAVERHATSKIRNVLDLESLMTLGFRGEALPSIAAVSKMTISSRKGDSPLGYSLEINGGEKGKVKEIGRAIGTEITIDNLFFNTPARKKFLKPARTELAAVCDMVERIAMSHPDIAFEVIQDKKNLFKTPGNNNLTQVIYSVYGGEVAKNMKRVQHDNPFIKGYVTIPRITRSSRHYYNFFLNGRLVKSQELSEAVEEAYHTRIPFKRYPIVVLYFNLSPDFFDVNVHPAKLEVKFKDVFLVKDALIDAIKSTLDDPIVSIPQIKQKQQIPQEIKPVQQQVFENVKFEPSKSENNKRDFSANIYTEENSNVIYFSEKKEDIPAPDLKSKDHITEYKNKKSAQSAFFSSLKVMGQLGGSYIIASGTEGLYIVDQHAAHERIRYEKIEESFRKQSSASSLLSVPITIELTSEQGLWLINNIVKLADLGFILEHFGNNTFLLRGVPSWHYEGNSQELLLDILEKLGNSPQSSVKEIISEEKLFSLACKSAVKANRFLTEEDISFLFEELDFLKNPYTCPHGRPIIINITYEEIKKRFLRT